MAARKKADKPPIDPDRAEEIRSDAQSGTNWALENPYGPACTCGMREDAGHAFVLGAEVKRGVCYRHGARQG